MDKKSALKIGMTLSNYLCGIIIFFVALKSIPLALGLFLTFSLNARDVLLDKIMKGFNHEN